MANRLVLQRYADISTACCDFSAKALREIEGFPKAITLPNGVDLRGFMAWSLYDNFEWGWGYAQRFGTSFSDFQFGTDPDAPSCPAGCATCPTMLDTCTVNAGNPNAGGGYHCCGRAPSRENAHLQTRTRKDSSKFLSKVWATMSVQPPSV